MKTMPTAKEQAELDAQYDAAERAGDRARLRARINRFLTPIIVVGLTLAFVFGALSEISALRGEVSAQAATISSQASRISSESLTLTASLERYRRVLQRLCADEAADDTWRRGLHALERRYRPPSTDAYFAGRDLYFTQRERASLLREQQCLVLIRTL